MFGVPDYGAFVVAIIVFLAIPGPGNLALLTATAKGGVRAGMAATFGVIAGDQTLLWLAVAVLAAQRSDLERLALMRLVKVSGRMRLRVKLEVVCGNLRMVVSTMSGALLR